MTPNQKPGLQFFGGIPLMVPNTTYKGEGFHISHNDRDQGTYGDVTTALVVSGEETAFYILNGDHRSGYAELLPQGLDACMGYFRQNINQKNKFSETPPEQGAMKPEGPEEPADEGETPRAERQRRER